MNSNIYIKNIIPFRKLILTFLKGCNKRNNLNEKVLKKYGLNEGIPEYLEAGAAAFFFYKFFQGF